MIRWSSECQVNVRWMSGECQVNIRSSLGQNSKVFWAWHRWTWNLFWLALATGVYINMFIQVCLVHLQLEQFSRKSVEIEPGTIEMLSPIELTQYYIQVRCLTYLFYNWINSILNMQFKSFTLCWLNIYHTFLFEGLPLLFFSSEMDPWLPWSWPWIKRPEDGNCIQEANY